MRKNLPTHSDTMLGSSVPICALYSILEPDIQELLRAGETKSTALVPLNQPTTFVAESAGLI